uniref:Chromosome 2 open reading frame 42 n=1 Tax=Vombatus ursinus TaxID=29139 RepID=A0A4X2L1G3_VOMUR
MEPNSLRTKVPAFLSDLGKATLRGIRKCPRCGTYNGTRGLSCKNKTCGTIFRYGARKQPSIEAVKIITGSDLHIYSVRQRDRGPDYRCFVELGVSETTIQTVDGTIISQLSSGRCYVPSCLKAATQGVVENQCQHIKLAINCQAEATPLTLKSSVLNSMQASPETKQTIWQLATEPTGPLVQRITKNILVVKCKASQKHSLGYLHASFVQKISAKSMTERRFFCSCQTLKSNKSNTSKDELAQRCIHFFACICAFASDETLAQEFSDFLSFDSNGLKGIIVPQLGCHSESTAQICESTTSKPKKRKRDEASACNQLLDESQVTLSFQDWLASVTERIHQTMHYQFDGKPEPLVFHIPQSFFDALQQRISVGSAKKRLPNSTTAFVRKDALPLGTFSKYTWHITNILQVKQILDTPEMPLEITRSFIQNRDGTYELFKCPKVEVENIAETYGRLEKQPVLRPLELKTFLKVGKFSECLLMALLSLCCVYQTIYEIFDEEVNSRNDTFPGIVQPTFLDMLGIIGFRTGKGPYRSSNPTPSFYR